MQNSNLRRLLWEVIKEENYNARYNLKGEYKGGSKVIDKMISDRYKSIEREYANLDIMREQGFKNSSMLMQKIKIELIKIEINTIIDNKK